MHTSPDRHIFPAEFGLTNVLTFAAELVYRTNVFCGCLQRPNAPFPSSTDNEHEHWYIGLCLTEPLDLTYSDQRVDVRALFSLRVARDRVCRRMTTARSIRCAGIRWQRGFSGVFRARRKRHQLREAVDQPSRTPHKAVVCWRRV